MDVAWPKQLQTKWKRVVVRGEYGWGYERDAVFETREYPAGTEGGRYQLWFDGRWAEDITSDMEARKGVEVMSYLDRPSYEIVQFPLETDKQDLVYYTKKKTMEEWRESACEGGKRRLLPVLDI